VPVFELAGRVGIDATQLERIEAGEVDSQLQLLFDLATALDSTLEEMLAGVSDGGRPTRRRWA
jgi:transcriptional regulator with XRE-family HTH domain